MTTPRSFLSKLKDRVKNFLTSPNKTTASLTKHETGSPVLPETMSIDDFVGDDDKRNYGGADRY